ncbi:MAG: helix-turn-helix transcriptional regulator [Pirellulales bacterium]
MSQGTPIIDEKLQRISEGVATFGTFLSAYKECSPEIQSIVDEMTGIVNDDNATKEEKEHAIDVVIEALFPSLIQDIKEAHRRFTESGPIVDEAVQSLDRQEAGFASRLRELMDDRGMTQAELAAAIGVKQPAISMMLNRDCRPQQRTVMRLADALQVLPDELWPPNESSASTD